MQTTQVSKNSSIGIDAKKHLHNTVNSYYEGSATHDKRDLSDIPIPSVTNSPSMKASLLLLRLRYIPLVPLILGIGAFVGAFYYLQAEILQLFVIMNAAFFAITGTLFLILAKISIGGGKPNMFRRDQSEQLKC